MPIVLPREQYMLNMGCLVTNTHTDQLDLKHDYITSYPWACFAQYSNFKTELGILVLELENFMQEKVTDYELS